MFKLALLDAVTLIALTVFDPTSARPVLLGAGQGNGISGVLNGAADLASVTHRDVELSADLTELPAMNMMNPYVPEMSSELQQRQIDGFDIVDSIEQPIAGLLEKRQLNGIEFEVLSTDVATLFESHVDFSEDLSTSGHSDVSNGAEGIVKGRQAIEDELASAELEDLFASEVKFFKDISASKDSKTQVDGEDSDHD